MASVTETGHAKNVANFRELITVVRSFEGQYQPIAEFLKVDALEAQAEKAEAVLLRLQEAETLAKRATAALQEQFKTLNTFTTQLMGILNSSGAKGSSIEEARAVQKRITGATTRKKKTDAAEGAATDAKVTRSTSRQSYDSRLEDFTKLVTVLQNIPEYTPHEEAFKIDTLQGKIKMMKKTIEENDSRELARSQAMHERNLLLYTPEYGISAVAGKVKEYIKAVFGGVKSAQYKLVSKIRINTSSI